MMRHYIISLKHTKKEDDSITLWRPDNSGYTWRVSDAGVYENIEQNYHDSEGDMPVLFSTIQDLSIADSLPNHPSILKQLGIKFNGRKLVRKEATHE